MSVYFLKTQFLSLVRVFAWTEHLPEALLHSPVLIAPYKTKAQEFDYGIFISSLTAYSPWPPTNLEVLKIMKIKWMLWFIILILSLL